jgi:hypothetical protein
MDTPYIALFPVFFLGGWCAVCYLCSAVSGWRRLASSLPARGQPLGRRFSMEGGMVGQITYSGCLTIYSSADGLYLSVWWPFRVGHPPVFIPWDAIRNATTLPRRFLWPESVAFDAGSPSVGRLQLPAKVFEHQYVAKRDV